MSGNTETKETSDDFLKRVNLMCSDTFTTMCLSLGTKIGVVDKMLSYEEPKTCKEIADDAGLKERYVQEWLAAMTTGKIVDLHKTSSGNKFMIPHHRRPVLSSKGEGMAVVALCVPMLAQVHGLLEECCKKEGPSGIPHECYKGYHQWGYRALQTRCDRFIGTLDEVPGLPEALNSGISICDLGCSVGNITVQIAEKFPNSQIHGVDISEDAIATARKSTQEKSLTNCHFHVADISNMPANWTEKWDFAIMYDVLHDIPHTTKALSEIFRVLKKGCYLSVIDVNMHTDLEDNLDDDSAPFLYGFSLFGCLAMSLAVEGSEGIGAAWGKEKALRMIEEARFSNVKIAKELGGEFLILAKKSDDQ